MNSFCENGKKFKIGQFWVIFGLILAIFLRSQSFEFAAIVQIWVYIVPKFIKIVWTVFENSKLSLKDREKKNVTIAYVVENFPSPKKKLRSHFPQDTFVVTTNSII